MAGLIEALRPVLALVLGALIDLIGRRARPTAEDGDPDTALRKRLEEKVKQTWGDS